MKVCLIIASRVRFNLIPVFMITRMKKKNVKLIPTWIIMEKIEGNIFIFTCVYVYI